jgi:thiopeptide-type bacteriocin biosynthesis protein
MQTWRSYHCYPLETPDLFLVRALKPFLAQHVWSERGCRAFFVRYADERGEHLRVRFRGEAAWLDDVLVPAWKEAFEGRGELSENTYQPEVERFGGEDLLPWAEEHFHISTRVVLDRISREQYVYGDAMLDCLQMHLITAHSAGFDAAKTAWYFGQLCQQWIGLYFRGEDGSPLDGEQRKVLLDTFQETYAAQQKDLRTKMSQTWESIVANGFDAKQAEWLRWLRGNQLVLPEFGDRLERALPSLLHLSANRLGIHNPDEVYLAYVLSRGF